MKEIKQIKQKQRTSGRDRLYFRVTATILGRDRLYIRP